MLDDKDKEHLALCKRAEELLDNMWLAHKNKPTSPWLVVTLVGNDFPALRKLIDDGLAIHSGTLIRLTATGLMLAAKREPFLDTGR